jgi:hypothetical protein
MENQEMILKKLHLNETNKRNYYKRKEEGRNKVIKTQKKPTGRKPKNAIKEPKINMPTIIKAVGRPKKSIDDQINELETKLKILNGLKQGINNL